MKADIYTHKYQSQKSTVVFIHGFAGDICKTWGDFPEFLKQHPDIQDWDIFSIGYPTSLFALESKRIWFAYPSIRSLADSLRTRIAYPPFDSYENLAFIAHSMGGLVVQRALMDDPVVFEKVSHLFMFGTPSGGLMKAAFGAGIFRKSQIRDMADRGEFIINLRRQWDEKVDYNGRFHFRAVRGMNDEFVSEQSCHLPFPQKARETIPGNHLEIVKPDSSSHLSVQIVVKGLRQRKAGQTSPKTEKTEDSDTADDPHISASDTSPTDCISIPRINLDSMPVTSPDLFGREEELSLLDEAWENPETGILVFIALGGVGKTSLVNAWLHNHMAKENFRDAEMVYAWSFYSQGAAEGRQASADRFLADALKCFGDPNPDEGFPTEKGRRLADLIKKQKSLIVLDGLEPVQHPPGPQEGKVKDEGLRTLLRNLAVQNPGLCVITTRLKVDDLKTYIRSSVKEQVLEHLSEEAGMKLLVHLGVSGPKKELLTAVKEFDGHALALTLLGTYLKNVYRGDIRKRDRIERLTYEEDYHGKHARRVMESYEKWLEESKKGRRQLAILRIMGLFDRPADKDAIKAVLAEPTIEGLTENLQGISDADWAYALNDLRELRLILKEDACEKNSLDCHPLIREHFSEKLKNGKNTAWKTAHSRLYGYFKNLPEKELPDTLEEMEPLYVAVRHGCMADQYEEALDYVYWERIRRKEQGYSIYRLGAFGADLTALSHFFSDIWRVPVAELPDEKKIFVMNRSGYCLRATGRLQEGKILLDLSLKEYTKQENWAEMTQAATNLSILHLLLADLITADNYARNSLEYAQKTKDWFWIGAANSALATILHAFGCRTEAKKYLLQLESDLKKQNPERTFLYSGPGYRICDLLMDFGLYEDIIIRTEWALKLYAGSPELFYSLAGLALSHVSMGRALLHKNIQSDVSDFSKISEHLETAIVLQRKSGYQEDLPIGLFARAELNRIGGKYDKARTDLNEACEIAEYGGMKLYLTDYHLETCRLCFAEGKARQAEKHLDAARKLIEETGYKRRLKDVEEIIRENAVTENAVR